MNLYGTVHVTGGHSSWLKELEMLVHELQDYLNVPLVLSIFTPLPGGK